MDDAELLYRYAEEGSEAAFSELVGRHFNLVYSVALRRVGGDAHRAKDVAQMVFVDLARKAASLSRHSALVGWLHTSTYFAAKVVIRGEQRRQKWQNEAHKMNQTLFSPTPAVDWDRLQTVLEDVMDELNDRDRAAVLWRFYESQPFAVLGEKLGLTETAARQRVNRALEKMHRSFARRGIESTTAALALMLESHAVVAAPAGLAETVTASALSTAVGGSNLSWLGKFIGKAKLATGVSGLIWIGGILGVPVVGAAAYELWTAWQARAVLAQESASYAAQQEQFRVLNHTAHAPLSASPLAKSLVAARDPKSDFQKFLMAYPQARATLVTAHKILITQIYGSFFRSAGLSASQIGQFEDLVAENWLRLMALTPAKFSIDVMPLPPADQIRAIMGDRAYGQFQDYGQTAYAHYWAYFAAANLPQMSFSADQVDELAEILAKNNAVVPPPYSFAPSTLVSIDWPSVMTQARPLFSDSQWQSAKSAMVILQLLAANPALP